MGPFESFPLIPILLLTLLSHPITAQRPAPTIVSSSSHYVYHGCWNETSGLPNTDGSRALGGGAHEELPGNMTVETCLAFCGTNGNSYAYAGLEYSRECWCANALSGLSVELPDSSCDLGCDGNATEICGGTLKLTVYKAGASEVVGRASRALMLASGMVLLVMNSL